MREGVDFDDGGTFRHVCSAPYITIHRQLDSKLVL